MQLRKIVIALLALLLAGAVMVPCVSAAEHHLTSDYPQDSKMAEWLSESDMINIVLSQKTIEKSGLEKQQGIITIPIAYLETKTNFISTKDHPSFSIESALKPDEGIVLIRMPEQMYKRFTSNAKDGKLSLPEDHFARYYENSSDLYSHLKTDGNTLQVLPSEKYSLRKITERSDSEEPGDGLSVISPTNVKAVLSYPQFFEERRYYDRIDSNENFNYCIGQITPDSWTLLGSALDKFDIFQEREYRFNSNEAIEIVVKYRDRNQGSDILIFPALYRSGASEQIPESAWEVYTGPVGVDKNNLPHAYGYHVQFSGGYYYIDIEDMDTMNFIRSYSATAAAGTSSFTDLWGSSEYRQNEAPTTNTFSATTNPVIDEWVYVVNDDWRKPEDAWEYVEPSFDDYVRVTKTWSSSGDLITRSYVEYP